MREDQIKYASHMSWVLNSLLSWENERADKFTLELTNLVSQYEKEYLEERNRKRAAAELLAQQMPQPGGQQQPWQHQPFQGHAAAPNLPQAGPLPGFNQMDPQFQNALQLVLRSIQQTSAAPHPGTSVVRPQVPQHQVRIPPTYSQHPQAETNP